MHRGYVKLWRKSFDSVIWNNKDLWRFWTWCLMKASHKPYKTIVGFQEVELNPGQLVFGRKKCSQECGISERTIRTCIEKLKDKKLTIKTTNKFSIITIINWSIYQPKEEKSDQQTDQQTTSKRPANDQQTTTNKNDKNIKNEKNIKDIYSASNDAATEQDFLLTRKKRKLTGKRLESFNLFWEAFNYKKGKAEAADSWYDIPQLTEALVSTIREAAKKEAISRKQSDKTPKMAQGWITGRRWEDEHIAETIEYVEVDL